MHDLMVRTNCHRVTEFKVYRIIDNIVLFFLQVDGVQLELMEKTEVDSLRLSL